MPPFQVSIALTFRNGTGYYKWNTSPSNACSSQAFDDDIAPASSTADAAPPEEGDNVRGGQIWIFLNL